MTSSGFDASSPSFMGRSSTRGVLYGVSKLRQIRGTLNLRSMTSHGQVARETVRIYINSIFTSQSLSQVTKYHRLGVSTFVIRADWIKRQVFVAAERVDHFFAQESSFVDGTVVDDLYQRVLLACNGRVEKAHQPIHAAA